MHIFDSRKSFPEAVGKVLGTSGWLRIEQETVDEFARITDDNQWIHVDKARATAGPFGGTIAHGHLVLSLLPGLIGQTHRVSNTTMEINYGLDRVRFPSPTMVGTRIRATATLASVDVNPDYVHVVVTARVDAEGSVKPVCVAETVTRYYL